jgi:hypothetical protein
MRSRPTRKKEIAQGLVAIVKSLFREYPEPLMMTLIGPFGVIWKVQIGWGSELRAADPADLGEMLAEGKVDIGVFHGIEFAWAQQNYPELRPLFVA